MRLTQFWELMESRFGPAYARSVAVDQVLSGLDGRTAEQALASGVDPKLVWQILVAAIDEPDTKL